MSSERNWVTEAELKCALIKLEDEYPELLKKTFVRDMETICGDISTRINAYLIKLGFPSKFITGSYKGRGNRFSCPGHCWVEMRVKKLRDGSIVRVIIDGAYAQFFPQDLVTKAFKDRVRLMFFIDDPEANEWYFNPYDDNH